MNTIQTIPNLMTAGACFMEPEEGDLRLIFAEVTSYNPHFPTANDLGNVESISVVVQEYGPRYSDDGFELCGGGQWETVCPLVDYPERFPTMVNFLPNLRASFQ